MLRLPQQALVDQQRAERVRDDERLETVVGTQAAGVAQLLIHEVLDLWIAETAAVAEQFPEPTALSRIQVVPGDRVLLRHRFAERLFDAASPRREPVAAELQFDAVDADQGDAVGHDRKS